MNECTCYVNIGRMKYIGLMLMNGKDDPFEGVSGDTIARRHLDRT